MLSVSSQPVKLLYLIAITLSLTLLVACGGGGGSGSSVGTTTTPLPGNLITDTSAARALVVDAEDPPSLTPTTIRNTFRSRALNADTLLVSDISRTNSGILDSDIPITCVIGRCNNIVIGDAVLTISLDNIGTPIEERFDLTRFNSQYAPVMVHRGVTLAQTRAAGRDSDNIVVEFLDYGGWLTESAFGVDILTVDNGSDEISLLVASSYGDDSGTRPTGTGTANWNGSMVGMNKASKDLIQGNADISIDFSSNSTNISSIMFSKVFNITTGNSVTSMDWENVPIRANGTFTSTTGGDIEGTFYGTGHTEIGGIFNRNDILGAFGATRQ